MAFKNYNINNKRIGIIEKLPNGRAFQHDLQNMAGQKYLNNRKSITMAQRKTEKKPRHFSGKAEKRKPPRRISGKTEKSC
jgi:hypothetical protein